MRRPFRSMLLGILLSGVGGVALAAPGRYLVVEVDAQGRATPVFYRDVDIETRAPATASQRKSAATDGDKLVASAGAWSEIAEVPRYLRGEFAENGRSGKIEPHAVRLPVRSFALRIPASAGDQLELRSTGKLTTLSLRQVAASANRLPLATMRVQKAVPAPTSGNRADLLVMGDGYTAGEQAAFNSHAQGLYNTFFGFTPYKEYASLVNWETLFTASAQSGADHPAYQAGCTQDTVCCADTDAQSDPRSGMSVSTAFDGRFCAAQIHRLVVVNNSKVLAAASAAPHWDQIMVILNDPVYGGSGGSISVVSANSSADLVAVHEFGHSFHGLADEYSSAYPGFPACSDLGGGPACEPNVTNQTTRAAIKWNSWLTAGIVTPTPSGTAGIGLFEGARYQANGMYRPKHTCGMRDLGAQFCSVCAQAFVLKLYSGGFGVPAAGIDLIEPGSEVPAYAAPIAYAPGSTVNFRATVLRPIPDTTAIQWYLDGVAIPGATGPSYNFRQTTATPATRTLELRVLDNTPLVKAVMAGSLLRHSRTWSIRMGSGARSDFNGDGRSDLAWRNLATGANALWLSANRTTQQAVTSITGLAWKIAGVGDFNGDRKADLLWRNESTGANSVWYAANSASAQNLVGVTGTLWKIVGTGDFDGDGKADILWRNYSSGANTIWRTGNQATQQAVTGVTDLNWKIVGVGDLNGDGKADIVWRHRTSGANSVWFSGSAALAQNLTTVTGGAWKIVGVGDFDGDRKADLLWRNTSSGANTYWRSGNSAAQVAMASLTDLGWAVAVVGDYNGDGKEDVAWRHGSNGSNVLWLSANAATAQGVVGVTDQNWKLMPLPAP